MSTLDMSQSVTGIIIRDEQVFTAERDGRIEFFVPDNERVGVGVHIASIEEPYMAGAASVRLLAVEEQAMSVPGRRHQSDTNVQNINSNLNNMASTRVHSFASLNLQDIYALRDSLNQLINTRNQINIDDGISAIDALQREQVRHTTALAYNSTNMYADTSGIMSRVIDGMEAELTPASIRDLTRDDVLAVIDNDAVVLNQDINAGDTAFKIVGNVWYVAAYMPTSMVYDFVEGTNRVIYLLNDTTGDYEPHAVRIFHVEYGTRYSLVVFRNTRHVIEFIEQRNISIRTTSGVRRGLKLPETAISTRRHYRIPLGYIHGEYEQHILLSAESGNIILPITIESYNDYHAYVPPALGLGIGSLLVPYDPTAPYILLSSENIHELSGVYMVRFGEAVFRVIDLSDSSIEMGYILLDPAHNPNISEFANIVTNADAVVEGQLLR